MRPAYRIARNGRVFQFPALSNASIRYAVHPDGTGTGWTDGDVDVDQPQGLAFRYINHLAKAVRKRNNKEHADYADDTVGGEHTPGIAQILRQVDGTADVTAAQDNTIFQVNGLAHSYGNETLWCITGATGDPTIVMLHPDRQYKGGDITWTGAHQFDASVDMTILNVDTSAFFNIITVDGSAKFTSQADFSLIGGGAMLDEDDMVSDSTEHFVTQQSIKAHVAAMKATQGLFIPGTTVFNTNLTAVNTWQDLDLSAVVGANGALVFLEIANSGGDVVYLKPKGYGSTPPNSTHQASTSSAGLGYFDTATNNFLYTCMATDSAGVIQIACNSNSSTLTIKVVAYIAQNT